MKQRIVLPPERAGHPAPSDLASGREQIARAAQAGLWSTELVPVPVELGGREALHFAYEGGTVRGIVLLLHGGGFRQGAPEIEGAFAEALVRRCAVDGFALRYRLAPEHPFPAGLSDAWEALQALRRRYPDTPLLVCGSSAGGGLAAGLGVLDAGQDQHLIDGLVLLSPWLDLTVDAQTYETNAASDPLFSRETAGTAAKLYLQDEDPTHPLASPVHADPANLPPTLIVVGSGEVLLDDSRVMHEKLCASGVPSRLEIIDGMDHVAVARDLSLPGAAECFELVAGFINQTLSQGGRNTD